MQIYASQPESWRSDPPGAFRVCDDDLERDVLPEWEEHLDVFFGHVKGNGKSPMDATMKKKNTLSSINRSSTSTDNIF